MSRGFINVSHSGSGDVSYYLREGECVGYGGNMGQSKEALLTTWQRIEQDEKLGNKSLGIRGRHDARVRTNYVLTMPNSLSVSSCIERVESIVEQTPIRGCNYMIVVHKGERMGIVNQHVHLIVHERERASGKKDRQMQRKQWLSEVFRPLYERSFSEEFSKGKEQVSRERVPTMLYKASEEHARQVIVSHNQEEDNEKRRKRRIMEELDALGKLLGEQGNSKLAKTREQTVAKEETVKRVPKFRL